MAIKISLGKFRLSVPFDELVSAYLNANAIEILATRVEHMSALTRLPFHHRDPFDRMLIAQAQVEAMPVVGKDPAWDAYGIPLIW